jgi:multidrug efflux pump subunit AcrB
MINFFKNTLHLRIAFLFLAFFIALLGVKYFFSMPRGLFPEVDYPRVVVEVNMGFVPLNIMEWGVTSGLEKELRAVPGVRLVKSSSGRGLSSINIFLNENEDISVAVQRVNAKIAEVRSLIPPTAKITVRPITASAFAGAEYCFTSKKLNTQELRTFVEYTIKPQVLVVPGIFNVKVLGGELPEYRVQLDATKLAKNNLTFTDIDDHIRNSNFVDFIGPAYSQGLELMSFGGRLSQTPEDISNIVVFSNLGRAVRIRDVGKVELGNAWKYKELSLKGTECVGLDVFYQDKIDQNLASSQVKGAIGSIVSKDKNGLEYRSWDLNDFTDAATNAVIIDLALGMLIIGAITFLFLGNLKYSGLALVSMPLAAAFTLVAMKFLNLSINLMTLGGLTAAIGLVVDNTVIVLELFDHQKNKDSSRNTKDILIEVLHAVLKPMFFGTITIALVFTPIGFLSGLSGMFFKPMAHVHGAALLISMVLAIFVLPGLLLLFRNDKKPFKDSPCHQPIIKDSWMINPYSFLIKKALTHPHRHALLLFVIPLCGVLLLPLAKTGFLPEWDEGDLVVDYRGTQPFSLKMTTEKLKPIEHYLNSIPEIDFYIRKSGSSLGSFDKLPYLGEIIIKLKKDRSKSVFTLKSEIGAHIEKLSSDFEWDFFQILPDRLNDLSGSGKPVVVYLRGDDLEKLDKAALIYKDLIAQVPGLDSVRIDEQPKSSEIIYTINQEQSRAIDLNPDVIVRSARFALFSIDSSSVQVGPQSIPIRISLESHEKPQESSIDHEPLYTMRGGLTTLGALGSIKETKNKVESNHIDGTPVQAITAQISDRDLGSVIKDIQGVLAKNPQDGVFTELGGDYGNQQRSFRELILAFLTGLILIFLTSLFYSSQLSTALSLTACSLIPPTFGLVGLVVTCTSLDVSSFSGLISVTGIAVANSFMALSAINASQEHLSDLSTAVTEGMISRIRPILMTNLAAMAGFLPIAIGIATGDEILRPFSIAVIAGLWGAMFTTLFLVPLFYRSFCMVSAKELAQEKV